MIKCDSKVVRVQIILSYLGDLLGEEDFDRYKEFAKGCKSETYEDVLEEYLVWVEGKRGGLKKVVGWFKQTLTRFNPF